MRRIGEVAFSMPPTAPGASKFGQAIEAGAVRMRQRDELLAVHNGRDRSDRVPRCRGGGQDAGHLQHEAGRGIGPEENHVRSRERDAQSGDVGQRHAPEAAGDGERAAGLKICVTG